MLLTSDLVLDKDAEAQSWRGFAQGQIAGQWLQVWLPTSVLSHCGLELFTGNTMMNFLFFPERTHAPPPGSTRRPRFSGRRADQTRCHGGRHHSGKLPRPLSLRVPLSGAHRPHTSEFTPQSFETARAQRHVLSATSSGWQWDSLCRFQSGIWKFARPLSLCTETRRGMSNHDPKTCLT